MPKALLVLFGYCQSGWIGMSIISLPSAAATGFCLLLPPGATAALAILLRETTALPSGPCSTQA